MNEIFYFGLILLYSIGLLVYGGYIRLIQFVDTFHCFACKEMDQLNSSYDYVIVGCGSAGSVIASRLAENKNSTVLVLEAGSRGGKLMDVPVLFPFLHKSSVDWQYRTVPQKNAAKAFNDQKVNWPMGRIVGGSSRINNMVYSRGHPTDFEEWFTNDGDYNYESDILPYFKKNERNRGTYRNDTKFHSQNGLNVVEDLAFVTPLFNALLQGVKLLGFPVRDLNGEFNSGFMQPQATTKDQGRWTASHELELQNKPNLILRTNAFVHKVLLKSKYEAYAVKYSYLGEEVVVGASKGIILCAGAVGTPKILLLSGIGPELHLKQVNITTNVNLPVGNNLQDHVTTGFDLVVFNTSLGINLASMMSPLSVYDYFFKSTGLWTMVGCEMLGSINTNSPCYKNYESFVGTNFERCFLNENNQTDLGIMVLPIGLCVDRGQHLYKSMGLSERIWREYFEPVVTFSTATILPIVLHPKSRGTVRLYDNDPYREPSIDPNYLDDPHDINIILKGIDFIKNLILTEPMQKLGARLNDRVFPGCEKFDFDTKPYWECYVRHLTLTSYHYAGTCKMGSFRSKDSVVGYNFRVHGTNKLYVVDGSVLPSLPSGNPGAVIMMLAEKAASEIRKIEHLLKNVCTLQEIFFLKRICKL